MSKRQSGKRQSGNAINTFVRPWAYTQQILVRNNLNRTFVCLLEKSTGHLKKKPKKNCLYCIVELYIDISCKQIGMIAKQHMQHYTKQICTACHNNYHVVCESIKGWIKIHVSLACCQNEQKVRGDETSQRVWFSFMTVNAAYLV